MQLDDPSAEKLLAFCSRLPALTGERGEIEDKVRHTLNCFDQRQREVQAELNQGRDMAALRCESDALAAARSVVLQLWQRRFDTNFPGA